MCFEFLIRYVSHAWWYRPIVLATWVAEVGGLQVQGKSGLESVQGKPEQLSETLAPNENYEKNQG